MAQSGKCLTLDFDSGHALMVHEFERCIGFYASKRGVIWDSLSLSLVCVHAYTHTHTHTHTRTYHVFKKA